MRGRFARRYGHPLWGDRRLYCPHCNGWVVEIKAGSREIYAVRGGADPLRAKRQLDGDRWRGTCPTCRATIELTLPDR